MPRATLLLLPLLLGACARPGPQLEGQRGRFGGTLRMASFDDMRSLDTAIGYDVSSWRFERLIYDGLLNYKDDSAELEPAIARAMPTIEDGRIFTFALRDDVLFHNGRKVVSEDFRYAIERILTPATISPAIDFFTNIVGAQAFVDGEVEHVAGIRTPDDQTLIFELIEPDVAFLNVLTMPFAYPIPREEVEKWSTSGEWGSHAVGAGPYRLEEWSRGFRIRVRRFEDYYRDDTAYVDVIEQRFGIEEFIQLMMFERGELDVLNAIPLPDLPRVLTDAEFDPLRRSIPESATFYCSMNCEMEPFVGERGKKVRQAFNYAVDKERICNQILSGTAVPARGVLPPPMPGYDPELVGYRYNPAKARQLLDQAGYGDGLEIELMTRSRPAEQRWAEAVQAYLREVGVTANMRAVAFPEWVDLAAKRKTVPFTVNAWFQDYPDPSNFLDVLLNGERITEQNCNNRSFYDNPRVNEILARAAAEQDFPRRYALYQEAERIIVDDAPWIFIYHPIAYRLVQPWVANYQMHPVWSSVEERCWLVDPNQPIAEASEGRAP